MDFEIIFTKIINTENFKTFIEEGLESKF